MLHCSVTTPPIPHPYPRHLSWGFHSDALMSCVYSQWPDAVREPLAHIAEGEAHPLTSHIPLDPFSLSPFDQI